METTMNNSLSSIGENYKGKKVLITGGLGFVGSNLAHRLCEYETDITLYTKTTNKMRNVKEISSKVKIVQGDITNYKLLADLIADKEFVFHLAAQTSNTSSMDSPFLDLDVNTKGTLTVLEACRRKKPEASIVSVGTVTQIGKPMKLPVDETHPEVPLTIYDADKLACEKYFKIYHTAFGLRTVFLRLGTVFGERQEVNNPRTGVTNSFISKALQGETIKIFGDGNFLRDYIYVENVVDALVLSALNPSAAGESFQVVTGRGIRFVDMVKTVVSAVKELTDRDARYEHVPWPAEWKMVDIGNFVGTYEKLKRDTGWAPKIRFEEGIKRTVEFYSKHLNEYL
jgi:UDP-glucose 4-epimerase